MNWCGIYRVRQEFCHALLYINHSVTVTVKHMALSRSQLSTQSQCTVPDPFTICIRQAFCNALLMHLLCHAGTLSRTGYALATLPRRHCEAHGSVTQAPFYIVGMHSLCRIHSLFKRAQVSFQFLKKFSIVSYILDYFLRSKIILHSLCHSPGLIYHPRARLVWLG